MHDFRYVTLKSQVIAAWEDTGLHHNFMMHVGRFGPTLLLSFLCFVASCMLKLYTNHSIPVSDFEEVTCRVIIAEI